MKLVRHLFPIAVGLVVAWAFWQLQVRGELDDGPDEAPLTSFPPTFSHVTKHGWPMFCILQNEYGELFVPSTVQVEHKVTSYYNLSVDVFSALLLIVASAYGTRRFILGRCRFSLQALMGVTFAVALLMAWWRVEYLLCTNDRDAALARVLLRLADSPMLRQLQVRPYVYLPLLFAEVCTILLSYHLVREGISKLLAIRTTINAG